MATATAYDCAGRQRVDSGSGHGIGLFSIYLGTVIGAGFATGKEIAHFFARHGLGGVGGTAVAGVLLGCFGALATQYRDDLHRKETLAGRVLPLSMAFAQLCVCSSVLAAFGQLFHEEFGLGQSVGAFSMCLLIYLLVKAGFRWVAFASTALVVVLVIWPVWLFLSTAMDFVMWWPTALENSKAMSSRAWLLSALIYAAYNFLIAYPSLRQPALNARSKLAGAVWLFTGGLVIGLLAGCICCAELLYPECLFFELPALRLAAKKGYRAWQFYCLALFCALLSTGIGVWHGLFSRLKHKPRGSAEFAMVLALLISRMGLQVIVEELYPVIGLLGLVVVSLHLKDLLRCGTN